MTSPFSYTAVRELLEHLRSRYDIYTLRDWDGGPGLILRHDVDLDVAPALEFAKLELDCGIRSSYFFLTTCPTYNPAATPNRRKISEIADLGFEVGLHFDASVYENLPDDELRVHLDAEISLMASIAGHKVESVSLHNPTTSGRYPLFAGLHNAYDPAIFGPDRYLSESRMLFRHDPYEFTERAKDGVVQLLLHPEHFTESGLGYVATLRQHLRLVVTNVDAYLRPINATYADELPRERIEQLIEQLDRVGVTPS
jgi:hypothetical protein